MIPMKIHLILPNNDNQTTYTLICILFIFSTCVYSIDPPKNNETVLMIIDMQPHYVLRFNNAEKPENIKKVEDLIKKQIAAIKEAKKNNVPILFIEYIIRSGSLEEKQTDKRLVAATKGYDKVKFFQKSTNGIFEDRNVSKKPMLQYLKEKETQDMMTIL